MAVSPQNPFLRFTHWRARYKRLQDSKKYTSSTTLKLNMQFKLSIIASLLSVLAVSAAPSPAYAGVVDASPIHNEVIQASPTTTVNGAAQTGVNVLGGPTTASSCRFYLRYVLIYIAIRLLSSSRCNCATTPTIPVRQ